MHLRPYMTCALCCRYVVEKTDLVFAVLSELNHYLGHTQPFFVPPRRPSYEECTIHIGSEKQSWRICQVPRCAECAKSPDAFLCHLNCMELVSTHIYGYDKHAAWKFIPLIICHNAIFSYPWPHARRDYSLSIMAKTVPKIPRPDPKQLFNILRPPHLTLVKQLYRLPPELLQMVEEFSAESILWRLLAALEWSKDLASRETQTMQLRDLGVWRRSRLFGKRSTAEFVVLGIDELGVKEIHYSDKLPINMGTTSVWYTQLESSSLSTVKVNLKNGHLCLTKRPTNLSLWDTPNVPDPTCYNIAGPEPQSCRLRTINLHSNVTGLTFFVFNGLTYALHTHYQDRDLSALDTFLRLSPKLQKRIVWIFVPLGGSLVEYKIEALWLRYQDISKTIPPEWSRPSLVIRTGKGRNHTIGLYYDYFEACQLTYEGLGAGSITQLIFSDPDLGDPVLRFGACASEICGRSPPRKMPKFPNTCAQEQVYYSYASLNGVCYAKIFYEPETHYCRGIMFQYPDEDVQVVGQCRDDLPHSDCITPFFFSYKEVENHVQVQVHSQCHIDRVPFAQGYHVLRMEGAIRWWFDVDYDYIMTTRSSILNMKDGGIM